MTSDMEKEIKKYLRTGQANPYASAWPGQHALECYQAQSKGLQAALLAELKRRAGKKTPPAVPDNLDLIAYTRERVAPMVQGLFPPDEQPVIQGILERAMVFLTAQGIEKAIIDEHFPHTAWTLANIYLESLNLKGLDGKRFPVVGMSSGDKCYISTDYFYEKCPFADFLVHEAAHTFHNIRRDAAGLPLPRRGYKWLLLLDFNKRELFAYACEVYSRIITLGATRKERLSSIEEYSCKVKLPAGYVGKNELIALLKEAVGARNGWKRILKRCSPDKR